MLSLTFICVLLAATSCFYLARQQTRLQVASGKLDTGSHLPFFSGLYLALTTLLPGILALVLWLSLENTVLHKLMASTVQSLAQQHQMLPDLVLFKIQHLAEGHFSPGLFGASFDAASNKLQNLHQNNQWLRLVVIALACLAGIVWGWRKLDNKHNSRLLVERLFEAMLWCCASIAVLTTIGIVFSVLFESIRFFSYVPVADFLFGSHWSPQAAIRTDQVASSGSFGALPLFWGTFFVSMIAMLVAVPTGLMIAIYLTEYSSSKARNWVKPALEILAGIPTVVYGFIAALAVAPLLRDLGASLGVAVSSESALAAGIVMGVMIIPLVSSLTDDVINAVPDSLREGALALGATRSEMIKHVVLPAAFPGIVASVILAMSRAIGETMIVVMAAGLAAKLTLSPLDSVTTVTVQIVTLLVGDQEFDSPKTLVAFALGLVLIIITLALNYFASRFVSKYHAQYQ